MHNTRVSRRADRRRSLANGVGTHFTSRSTCFFGYRAPGTDFEIVAHARTTSSAGENASHTSVYAEVTPCRSELSSLSLGLSRTQGRLAAPASAVA